MWVVLVPPEDIICSSLKFHTGIPAKKSGRNAVRLAARIGVVDLPADDERILHYLKGETIEIEPEEAKSPKGWQLLCVSGYPLGWGKLVNGLLKNKFLASWRLS